MRRGRRRACNRCNIQSEHTMLQRWVSDQKPIAATHNQKPRSRRGSVLRATCVAMVQGPACVKERERKLKKNRYNTEPVPMAARGLGFRV
jgi:hypothetical protein